VRFGGEVHNRCDFVFPQQRNSKAAIPNITHYEEEVAA
jgi:hypothetical protein